MSYDQPDNNFDKHQLKDNSSGTGHIARQAYGESAHHWNADAGKSDTASQHLPGLTLDNGAASGASSANQESAVSGAGGIGAQIKNIASEFQTIEAQIAQIQQEITSGNPSSNASSNPTETTAPAAETAAANPVEAAPAASSTATPVETTSTAAPAETTSTATTVETTANPASSDTPTQPAATSDAATTTPATTQPAAASTATESSGSNTSEVSTAVTPAAASNVSGGFNVINGQIIGPDGQPFEAKGVAMFAGDTASQIGAAVQAMPGLNFVRLASIPGENSPEQVESAINAIQTAAPGTVVEVEDHTSSGTDGTTDNTLHGSALATEAAWYGQIASDTKGNSDVWFGTPNEPNAPENEANVLTQQNAIYSAIRGSGNNSMIMLEANGGTAATSLAQNPTDYNNMTNVAIDLHYYGWESGGAKDLQSNISAIQNEESGFQQAGMTQSDGNGGQQAIPFIVGEYGDAAGSPGLDANANGAVDAAQTAASQGLTQGAVAWMWDGYNAPSAQDALTQDGTLGTLTDYGQEVANWVNTGNTGSVQ